GASRSRRWQREPATRNSRRGKEGRRNQGSQNAMTMNRIGKGLVLVNTAASLVALAWAAGVFFQFTDWGWKEPRSELGLRIPSEYDKRTATFKEAVKARDMALPALQPAWASLREAEERFPQNHLFY